MKQQTNSQLKLAAIIAVSTVLSACSGQNGVSPSQTINIAPMPTSRALTSASHNNFVVIKDDQIASNIDTQVQGEDRIKIAALMKALPDWARHNVVYFPGDGSILSNRVDLKTRSRIAPISGGKFRDIDGVEYAAPMDDKGKPTDFSGKEVSSSIRQPQYGTPPGNSGNTGAFRRVYSTPGYGNAQGQLVVPCGFVSMAPGDTPYVYSGGWANDGNAVDAGFQISPAHSYLTAFIKLQNQSQINLGPKNYACGSQYSDSLTFFVASAGIVAMFAEGADASNPSGYNQGYPADQTIAVNTTDYNWEDNCIGCVVKRMTSIAQGYDDFTDSSLLGAGSINQRPDGTYSPVPLIEWNSWRVGYTNTCNPSDTWACEGSYMTWASAYGGGESWPNDNSRVPFTQYDFADETDGIFLHP